MTILAEAGARLSEIARESGNSFENMSNEDLFEYVTLLNAAAIGCCAALVEVCGGSIPRAEAMIKYARKLPRYKLERKLKKFETQETPSRPVRAAWIANLLLTSEILSAQIERRMVAASVN